MNSRSASNSVLGANTEPFFNPEEGVSRPGFLSRQSRQVLLMIVLAMASYLFMSHFILQTVQVVGVSMTPTLQDADHYFLNRWIYHWRTPQHNDIVVIKDPTDGVYVVKRIIATPGESVFFKDGRVFVNGKALQEPYLAYGTSTFSNTKANSTLILCGKDQYFVLGDNRDNSYDSRIYGPVRRHNILGSVIR